MSLFSLDSLSSNGSGEKNSNKNVDLTKYFIWKLFLHDSTAVMHRHFPREKKIKLPSKLSYLVSYVDINLFGLELSD